MRISAKAEIKKEVLEIYKDSLKHRLRENVTNELMKHNVFIEPPMKDRNNNISMEMHFYALSFDDIRKLNEFTEKYPELKSIIAGIIIGK